MPRNVICQRSHIWDTLELLSYVNNLRGGSAEKDKSNVSRAAAGGYLLNPVISDR